MQRTFTIKEVYPIPNTAMVVYTGSDGNKYTSSDSTVKGMMQQGKEVSVNIKDQASQKGNWSIITVIEANGAATVPAAPTPGGTQTPKPPDRERSIEHQVALKVAGELAAALITTKGITDTHQVIKSLPLLYAVCERLLSGEITVEH